MHSCPVALLVLASLVAFPAQAATLYCSPSGGGSGADFNNLCTLPNTTGFLRGNEYVIVDGNYGSKTLSTAQSGTTTITIRKAASTDSAVAGYAAALHDGQASFGTLRISTPYWIVDGKTRTETTVMEAPAGYGIRATEITADSINGDNASNSVFRHMDVGGAWSTETSPTCANTNGSAVRIVYNQTNITFHRMALHNKGSNNSALVMAHGSSNIVWEYVDFYQGWGKAAIASPNVGQQRHTIRHSRFWDATRSEGSACGGSGVGITTEIGTYSWDGETNDNLVYGNIFYGTASGGRNAVLNFGEPTPGPDSIGAKAFNNTFVGFPESPVLAHIYLYGGSGNEARNNLFYDITGAMKVTANSTSNNLHVTSGNPFIAGGYPTTLDFRLASDSAARDVGISVGSPYDTDPLAVTRGADGSWDVGAYEYVSGAGDTTPPTVTSRTIPAAGTSAVLVFDEPVTFANNEPTLSADGGAVSLTYASGTGTDTLTFTTSRQILGAETVTMSYTQAGDGIEDLADNDLASFTDQAVTNSSAQTLVALSALTPASGTRLRRTVTSTTIGVSTDKAASCRWGPIPGLAWGSLTPYTTTGGTAHSSALAVTAGRVYQICARCRDTAAVQYSADACAAWDVRPERRLH